MSNNGRFPPIAEATGGGLKSTTVGQRSSDSNLLPRMTPKQGAYSEPVYSHGKSVGKENVMVVGTSQSTENGELPEDWTQMRVNVSQEDDSHRTKLEWENQIAKHILSMFATTHAVKNISEGTALLDFVDVDKTAVKTCNLQIPIQHADSLDLLQTRPPRPPGFNNSDNKDADENCCQQQRKKKKKVKKIKKKLALTESNNRTDISVSCTKGIPESQYSIAERVILRVHAEAEAAERALGKSSEKEKDKYRITNTIKLKDGQEIVVRGTPRCYPIWFVSTGDVYADWTSLPGGVKLQAHLNVLYEQQKYQDYLGIVETVIIELWRKKKYGEEEFTLGSFGHSAAPTATHSGTNTMGTNTGANTARSHASQHNSSRRSSHSGGNTNMGSGAYHTGRKSTSGGGPASRYASVGDSSPGDGDAQFGNAIVWEDAGEEGLIPKVVGSESPLRSRDTVRGRGHSRGTASSPEMLPTVSTQQRGGTLSGADPHGGAILEAEQQITGEALAALWQQLIMACIAMGILFLERKRADQAMLLFKRAEEWAANDEIVTLKKTRKELKAHVRDAISYYFFKRKKSIAALGYSEQAMALYEDTDNLDGIAVCMLHVAAVHSQLGEFKEAHKKLFQFLAMVEGGRLAETDATPKQLCLVAIGYHNLAVVQLKLAMPDLACKNSQNARKIARLCLSYSNRWIDTFQYTHEIALSDLKYDLRTKQASELSPAQLALVIELSEALFDPFSDAHLNEPASLK